ncbi:carbohydrate-binding module family 13 protein [Lactarius psammicola]|nr:carbohydrate-binding module family 13 protein [Lactarius psammicola]
MSITSGNGLVLDLSGANHKSILGWDFHGSDNQQWITEKQDDGQWTIRSVRHQKYLGFESTPEDGTPLVGLDEPQLWDIEILSDSEDHDNPRVKLWVRGTLLVVEYPKENSAPGPLQLWAAWDGKNQVWVLEEYF